MSELPGFAWLLTCSLLFGGAAVLAACCLRRPSVVELLLASYVLAWTWLIATTFALSPFELVTRAGLLAAGLLGLLAALGGWLASGRPRPPPLRPATAEAVRALRSASLAPLTIAVGIGLVYSAGSPSARP